MFSQIWYSHAYQQVSLFGTLYSVSIAKKKRKKRPTPGRGVLERTFIQPFSYQFGLNQLFPSAYRFCTMARLWRWMATPWGSWLITCSQTQIIPLHSQTGEVAQEPCSTESSSGQHLMSSRASPFPHTNISIMGSSLWLSPKSRPLCQSGMFLLFIIIYDATIGEHGVV